jgi:hypothetical protein
MEKSHVIARSNQLTRFPVYFHGYTNIVPAGCEHIPRMRVHQGNGTIPPLPLCKFSGSRWYHHLQARQRRNKLHTELSVSKGMYVWMFQLIRIHLSASKTKYLLTSSSTQAAVVLHSLCYYHAPAKASLPMLHFSCASFRKGSCQFV